MGGIRQRRRLETYTKFFLRMLFLPILLAESPDGDAADNPPIDSSDFHEIVSTKDRLLFVDKTLMLEAMASCEDGTVSRVARPRGWGKTVNLDMMRRFFEMEVDENGQELPLENRRNRNLFLGDNATNSSSPLKISSRPLLIENYLGRYPVIWINLRNVTGTTYLQFLDRLKAAIADLYGRYRYLNSDPRSDSDVRTTFDRYANGTASAEQLTGSLKFLGELLRKRFHRKVIVLLDNYDLPRNHLFVAEMKRLSEVYPNATDKQLFYEASTSPDFHKLHYLMENVFDDSLKESPSFLKQAIICGTYYVHLSTAGELGFEHPTKLNDPLRGEWFTEYYGFSDSELDECIGERYNRTQLRQWYGHNLTGRITYVPWSVRHFAANGGKFDDYWVLGSNNETIDECVLSLDSIQNELQSLLDEYGGEKTVGHWIKTKIEYNSLTVDMSVLYFTGYLNLIWYHESSLSELSAANLEVKNILKSKVTDWVYRKLGVGPDCFTGMARLLNDFKTDYFRDIMKGVLSYSPIMRYEWQMEVFYNGIMKCLIYAFNREGYKKLSPDSDRDFDNMILLLSPSNDKAIALKYDRVSHSEELEETADSGLKEIEKREYNRLIAELSGDSGRRVERMLKIYIIFFKRSVVVKYRIEPK